MKILMVTPFYPPDVGGIAYHVSNIAHQLSRRHEITIVRNDIKYGTSWDGNIKIVKVPSIIPPSYPFESLSSFRIPFVLHNLFKLILRERFDIIHLHGHHYPITWLAASLAKIRNIPSIMTIHGMYALTWHPTWIEEAFNCGLVKKLLSVVSGIISITPSVDNFIRKYETNSPEHFVIPSGIDLQTYRKNIDKKWEYRNEYGLPRDKLIILYRGRFVDVKGISELATAIKNLNGMIESENVHFVLCGDGPLRDVVVSNLKDIQNCSILGWTDYSKVHELYIASDAFILPAKWEEGLGITVLEAMAADLHILATFRGGITDILADYPWKSRIENPSSGCILDTLVKYINQEKPVHTSSDIVNAERYLERFDWTNVVNRIEEAYQIVKGDK